MSLDAFRNSPTLELARALVDEHPRTVLSWALPQWSELNEADQERFGRAVPDAIGRGTFLELEQHTQGDLTHAVARFDVDDREMVLIPGGTITLGWERAPIDSLQDSWEQVRAQVDRPHGIQVMLSALDGSQAPEPPLAPKELHNWLDAKLSAHRTVTIAPFLIETAPAHVPWDQLKGDGDEVLRLDRWLRSRGSRLATPDEWEYAASGGSRALFRWGDYWPHDVDTYCVTEGEAFKPNAFGLRLNIDPYWPEVVSDGGQMRAGDGGEMVCGGAPPFATWLTQMPGFIYDLRYLDYRDICLQQSLYRAVIDIVEDPPALVEWVAPSPQNDLRAAATLVGRLCQEYDGLRARPGRELERLKKRIPEIRAIAQAHEDEPVLTSCSALFRKAGFDVEAVELARRAVSIDRNIVSLATLGFALRCAGEIDEAVQAFVQAQAEQPRNPNPFLDAGDMLAEAKRVDEAISYYEKALQIAPGDPYAVPTVLYYKALQGDAKAKSELDAHIETHPRDQYARSLMEKLG